MKDESEEFWQFTDLSASDVADLSSLCLGCVYWELPEEFDRGPSEQEMHTLKEEWLLAHARTEPLGKVARKGGEIVGFVQFGPPELYPQQSNYRSGPVSADAMLVTCLFVKSECRRRGLAKRLLSLAEAAARQAGYHAIESYARRGSSDNPSGPIELYQGCGFAVVRDDPEFPLVRKALPASNRSSGAVADAWSEIAERRPREGGASLTDRQLVQGDVQEKLKHALETIPLEWLLEGEAFVRYHALVDLLGRQDTDEKVVRERSLIPEDHRVRRILDRRNADGYWGTPQEIYKWWPRKDTTFWVLGMLADFGLRKGDEGIADAAEYVLRTQLACGAFGWGPPATPGDCFTGILTEALAKLGYGLDPRLAKAYDWLAQRQRLDGGFWCKSMGQPGMPRQFEPSCAFATLCVLGALVQHPQLKESPAARNAAAFLLSCWDNRGKIRYAGHDSQIGRGWEELKYPFTDYRILKYLDILTQLEPTAHDSRIALMIDLLMSKRDPDGRFYAESIHRVWSDFDFGQKAQSSRWITLLVYRIARRLVPPRRGKPSAAT